MFEGLRFLVSLGCEVGFLDKQTQLVLSCRHCSK